jgi:putative oxidoreductase
MTDAGLLVLRLVLFVTMAFHGTQKLFGWFDGGGLDRAEKFFRSQGFRPPRLMALVAGVTETAGAVLLGTGLATPLAVAMIAGTLVNVLSLHVKNGLDARKHGCEHELMLLAGVVAVGLSGPGVISLDHALGLDHPSWAGLAALGLAAIGGLVVVLSRDRAPAQQLRA